MGGLPDRNRGDQARRPAQRRDQRQRRPADRHGQRPRGRRGPPREADRLCEPGPGHALAGLAAAGCDVPAVSLEARTADDRGPAHAAAALFAAGAVNSLEPMLAGREARPVDIWQERIVVSAGVRPDPGEPAEAGSRTVAVAGTAAANGTGTASANGSGAGNANGAGTARANRADTGGANRTGTGSANDA